MSPDVAALIPAYDCAATVGPVVSGARAHVAHVLVVDDGSRDATAAAAAAAGAEVLRLPTNAGKGAALRAGFARLAAAGFVRVLTLDGDGQHLPEEMPRLLAASDAEPDALVIGARQIGDQEVKAIKLFGNRFANRWVEIASGLALPDTQSGFRVYPLATAILLGARSNHYDFETELLIRAARLGVPVRSVPVRVYYPPAAERVSHYRPWRDTVRIITVVLREIFRGLIR